MPCENCTCTTPAPARRAIPDDCPRTGDCVRDCVTPDACERQAACAYFTAIPWKTLTGKEVRQ